MHSVISRNSHRASVVKVVPHAIGLIVVEGASQLIICISTYWWWTLYSRLLGRCCAGSPKVASLAVAASLCMLQHPSIGLGDCRCCHRSCTLAPWLAQLTWTVALQPVAGGRESHPHSARCGSNEPCVVAVVVVVAATASIGSSSSSSSDCYFLQLMLPLLL